MLLLLCVAFALTGCGSFDGVRLGDNQIAKIPIEKLTDEVKVAETVKVAEEIEVSPQVGYDRSSRIRARDYTSNNSTELMSVIFKGIIAVLLAVLGALMTVIGFQHSMNKRLMKRIEKLSEDKKIYKKGYFELQAKQ